MLSQKDTADSVMNAYPNHTFFNNDPENYSPHFSWNACELCDGLAGDRYNITAVIIGGAENERIDFEVCGDCMYYVEYGEGPPEYFEER